MKFNPNTDVPKIEEQSYDIDPKLAKYDGFSTISMEESNDAKMVLADALINPDFKNNECIGKEFWCIGFHTRVVECGGKQCLGVILFDDSWNSYSTVSAGVAKIVKAWIDAEVEPSWEYPVRVKYERVQQGVYQYYTLKTVKGMKYEPPEA